MRTKAEYLAHLKHLRYDMTNEIPNRVIHSDEDQPMKYKVRKNWFQGVIADADVIIDNGYASQRSIDLFNQFFKYWAEDRFWESLTTKEDMDKGDSVLDSLIEDLEKK